MDLAITNFSLLVAHSQQFTKLAAMFPLSWRRPRNATQQQKRKLSVNQFLTIFLRRNSMSRGDPRKAPGQGMDDQEQIHPSNQKES
jgi:hypothetical protein